MIDADRFTPVDDKLIPTGELKPVAGTPFDFTKSTAIGARIDANDPQIKFGRGYDHNWVLNKGADGLTKAAEVHEPKTGRVMEVWTTEPAPAVLYRQLPGWHAQGQGQDLPHRSGFCMETQHYPDSPNKPDFPTTTEARRDLQDHHDLPLLRKVGPRVPASPPASPFPGVREILLPEHKIFTSLFQQLKQLNAQRPSGLAG